MKQDNESLKYLPLVEQVARKMVKNFPSFIEVDDLVSEGFIGLMDALEKFDDSYGYKFETYARFRIQGAILDSLRKLDRAPRALRSKNKDISQATSLLQSDLGRQPTDQEIANLLDWELEEVHSVQSEVSAAEIDRLDEVITSRQGTTETLAEQLAETDDSSFNELLDLRDILVHNIDELSPQAKTVLTLFYVEELPLRVIGDLLSVTESRACQIHTDSLRILWDKCTVK